MILIDVDGTLVDSVPDLAYCVDEMMTQLGRPVHGEEKVRDWVGNGVERLVRRALIGQLDGEPSDEDFEKAYPIYELVLARNFGGSGATADHIRTYEDALRFFLHREWTRCRELLETLPPEDEPAGWLSRQAEHFLAHEPAPDWAGEVVSLTK